MLFTAPAVGWHPAERRLQRKGQDSVGRMLQGEMNCRNPGQSGDNLVLREGEI